MRTQWTQQRHFSLKSPRERFTRELREFSSCCVHYVTGRIGEWEYAPCLSAYKKGRGLFWRSPHPERRPRSFGSAALPVVRHRLNKAVLLSVYIIGLNNYFLRLLPDSYSYSYHFLSGKLSRLMEAPTDNINSFNRFRCKRSFHD
jgi:hypothetical protein